VHYWADLQSVHLFRCYGNIHVRKLVALYTTNAYSAEREMSASACTRSIAGWFAVQAKVTSPEKSFLSCDCLLGELTLLYFIRTPASAPGVCFQC